MPLIILGFSMKKSNLSNKQNFISSIFSEKPIIDNYKSQTTKHDQIILSLT